MMQDYINPHTRKVQNLWQTYMSLVRSAGSQQGKLVQCLLWAALSAALFGVALALLYPVLQALAQGRALVIPVAVVAVLLIASIACRLYSERYDTVGHANTAINEWRTALGHKLKRIALADLDRRRSGEISAILVQSVNEAAGYAFTLLTTIIYGLVIPVAAALTLLFFDWRFALILLLALPPAIPLYLWRRRAFRRGFSILAEANGKLKGEAIEFTQGLEVLKATGQTESRQSRFAQTAHDVAAIQRIGTKKGEKPNLIITSVVQLGLIAVICCGAYWAGNGSASYLLLAAALIIIARVADVLNFFVQMSSLLEIFVIGAEKLQTLMAQPELPQTAAPRLPKHYDICLENVSFTYRGQTRPALENINLTLPERSLTALAGGSGSGKTTLARMILRYADPDSGSITIGGVDIRDMSQSDLMGLISVVFQDVYLFQDSILNNIRLAKPDANDEAVVRAAELAQCHEFIMRLPEGYQTMLTDTGSGLSGGEKQRIAIARAILKDAPILILDEPTAALDTQNERAVQKALDELVPRKTVLVIAHRLSTIIGAQQTAVMSGGRITESGTHNALLLSDGLYADFWRLQHPD